MRRDDTRVEQLVLLYVIVCGCYGVRELMPQGLKSKTYWKREALSTAWAQVPACRAAARCLKRCPHSERSVRNIDYAPNTVNKRCEKQQHVEIGSGRQAAKPPGRTCGGVFLEVCRKLAAARPSLPRSHIFGGRLAGDAAGDSKPRAATCGTTKQTTMRHMHMPVACPQGIPAVGSGREKDFCTDLDVCKGNATQAARPALPKHCAATACIKHTKQW